MLPPLPDFTHRWELHELERRVDSDYPMDDDFTKALRSFYPAGEHDIIPRIMVAWHCENCGCILMGDRDGDTFFPDRYVATNDEGGASCNDWHCRCHQLPHSFAPSAATCSTCGRPLYRENDSLDEAAWHHYPGDQLCKEIRPVMPPSASEMSQARRTLVRVEHDLTE